MTNRVAILTCVGNDSDGTGPGHTSLVVGSKTYSFEAILATTAWKTFRTTSYVADNTHRPLVIQEISANLINSRNVLAYIMATSIAGLDYGSAGVCSQQASLALSMGISGGFNPSGFDTPWRVYNHCANRGLASSTYLIWNGNSGADAKLASDFSAEPAHGTGILSW